MASQNPDDQLGPLRFGNDDTPLMAYVPEPPPSHWGKTLTDRTKSEAYAQFLLRARKQRAKNQHPGDFHGR